MAKIKIYDDNEQMILVEYFISDEYLESAMALISEQIRTYVLVQEKEKMIVEMDEELKNRVNANVAIINLA